MQLQAIVDRDEIKAAIDQLTRTWADDAETFERSVGWQGGGGKFTVHWRADLSIWLIVSTKQTDNRYWCAYGTTDPSEAKNFGITCEINFPFQGINRSVAGVFAADDSGRFYMCHSGNVRGVLKEDFVACYSDESMVEILWPDGQTDFRYVVSAVDSRQLAAQIRAFVLSVERIKELANIGGGRVMRDSDTFTAEFGGTRASYSIEQTITARCRHGVVVGELRTELDKRRIRCFNDRERDLYLRDTTGTLSWLFEVKTSVDRGSMFTAIGQLLVYSVSSLSRPKKVLVVPEQPPIAVQTVLRQLGVRLLTYAWSGELPVFHDLDAFVQECHARPESTRLRTTSHGSA